MVSEHSVKEFVDGKYKRVESVDEYDKTSHEVLSS